MRRQNPPQALLDRATEIERYLGPAVVGAVYALGAAVSFGLLALLFAALVEGGVFYPSGITLAVFVVAAMVPAGLAVLAFQRRPTDPFSAYLRSLADSCRRPVSIYEDRCSFKVLLVTGEALCVNLSFHYPVEFEDMETKMRLNVFARAALERNCSTKSRIPSDREIEQSIDDALEFIAAEADIPILYAEVRDVHKVRDAYSRLGDLAPSEYLGTGTLG